MRRMRLVGAIGLACLAGALVVAGLLQFLAPDVAYHVRNRAREVFSGQRGRTYRIALGAATGAGSRVARVLNQYLRQNAGYELELVNTVSTGTIPALTGGSERVDLAMADSASDALARAQGVYALAALEPQHFFVIVPNNSPVQEFRDLAGPVNTGARRDGQPPTLGDRVLEYYGHIAPADAPSPGARVTVVQPKAGNVQDFESGHNVASTRTQFLRSELIENILRNGQYRLVPIRDHEALARSIPGTSPGFIPAGLYGPGRRVPAEPVPTITVTQLLVATDDVPGRVVRDILEVLYDQRFMRDLQYGITEESGRNVGGLPLHPAAEIYYHRNDLVTSDRLGRVSFVASGLAAIAATAQFLVRFRRNERVRTRRRRLGDDLAELESIRRRIEEAENVADTRILLRQADDLLSGAEQEAAAGLLDSEGIQSIRSLHRLCAQASGRSFVT